MGIKTDQMVEHLPPKEPMSGIDWLKILDSFDPSTLEQKYVNECARRNPYDTCYRCETPPLPVLVRLEHSKTIAEYERRELEACVHRIEEEGLTKIAYKNARAALIKAIGSKGAVEYIRREYESLGEEGRAKQEKEYHIWEKAWNERREAEELWNESEYGNANGQWEASVHEKVIRIRKGVKGSNGKCLTQRDFAKFLEYPINKYVEAEKIDRYGRGDGEESPVEEELLEKLIYRCHANPYWLFDYECEALFGEEEPDADAVRMGDEPCVFATADVILRWIREGKPKKTSWGDSLLDFR